VSVRLKGQVARTGGKGCAYWELVGKSDRK